MEARTDEALLAAFAAGDRLAFDALVRRHQDRVFQFAGWFARESSSAAEDIASDIWIEVFRSAPSFRGDSSFRTWLFGIGRHVCLRRLRRRGLAPQGLDDDDGEPLEIPDGEAPLLESLVRAERERLVRAAVASLPSHYGVVLMLREWEGLSYEDIARALDIPLGTVRSRLHNGLIRLSLALKLLIEEQDHGL